MTDDRLIFDGLDVLWSIVLWVVVAVGIAGALSFVYELFRRK